jgi:serine/threonine protein kinase
LPHLTSSAIAQHLEHCPRCAHHAQKLDTALDSMAGLVNPSAVVLANPTRNIGQGVATPSSGPVAGSGFPFLQPGVHADEIGRLGSYRVLGLLGKGGMAYVFQAEDIALRRPVALKVMKPELNQDPEGWQRFLREARIMAAIKHEHLVTVYQVGQEGPTVYLAMELLQGESLGTRMDRQASVPLPEVLRLGREIACGLAVVHAQGLVHRDIKPDNIWLEAPRERVKILDFGLARLVHSDDRLTQAGTVMGTPSFMAPEQARGRQVDARCDLFSLGCILYTLGSGHMPFQAEDTMGMLTALAVDEPAPIHEHNAALPPALSALVMQLLAKDPQNRPRSAQEVVERLEAIEREVGVEQAAAPAARAASLRRDDTPYHPDPRRPATAQRRRWLAGAAVLAAALGLGYFAFSGGSSPPEKQAPPVRATPAIVKQPVKVFLLAGQSDMGGRGALRTVDWLGQDSTHGHLLKRIKNPDGSWVSRSDVWVHYTRERDVKNGPLSVGFGQSDQEIGPELLFGHVLGDHFNTPVLLIKVTLGPMSLAVEARPPSAGGALNGGPFYRNMVETIRDVLANPGQYLPAYEGQGAELAGFVWFQGWNDMIDVKRRLEYSANLAHLIHDVRRDLGVPNLPVVIGELGVNGSRPTGEIEAFRLAQGVAARRPEFKGTVILAPTHECWDNQADELYRKFYVKGQWQDQAAKDRFDPMGSQPEYLYFGSAKINALIGQMFGESMQKLLGERLQ